MTAQAAQPPQAGDQAGALPGGLEVLARVWTMMPILAVLNLAAASAVFASSAIAGATSWASAGLYPVPLLWLLVVLDRIVRAGEGEHGAEQGISVRFLWAAARHAVRPAVGFGVPVSVILVSALTAAHIWLTKGTVIMLPPLVVGAVAFTLSTFVACAVVRAMPATSSLRGLRAGWREALAAPARNLAAASCLVAIPVLVTVLNPGVLLAIPAPFALCALLASGGPHRARPQ